MHIQRNAKVQFSHSVTSDSLQPHGLQHFRLPCPSPTPRVCSSSCPLSRWCHPTISSSVIPFSCCLQSCPASGSFLMSQLFAWGGQSIGALASASVLPVNIQDWFPLGWTVQISLQSKGLSRVFSNTTLQEHQFSSAQPSFWSNSHIPSWCDSFFTGKTIALTRWTFVGKIMSLLLNMCLGWSWLFFFQFQASFNFMAAVTICSALEPPKIVCHCFQFFLIYLPWNDGTRCHDLSFLNVEF